MQMSVTALRGNRELAIQVLLSRWRDREVQGSGTYRSKTQWQENEVYLSI